MSRRWRSTLAVWAGRGLFTLVMLQLFGILWPPLAVALLGVCLAAVAGVVLVVAGRLALLRWRGW